MVDSIMNSSDANTDNELHLVMKHWEEHMNSSTSRDEVIDYIQVIDDFLDTIGYDTTEYWNHHRSANYYVDAAWKYFNDSTKNFSDILR